MKLIHLTEYKDRHIPFKTEPIRLKCASGMAMSQCIHSVQMFCHEGARDNNDSAIVWESSHHEIMLWFEDEKYRTYFSLSLKGKGA